MVDSTTTTHASPSADTQKKAASKSKGSRKTSDAMKDSTSYFTSSIDEDALFDIVVGESRLRPSWDSQQKHPIWAVPKALLLQFSRHTFVQTGRIIPVND